MYKAQSIILNRSKHSNLCSIFDEWTKLAKETYNSALFIERQLISSSKKNSSEYTDNELEIRSYVQGKSLSTQKTIGYVKLERLIREHRTELYKSNLPNQSVQHILKSVVQDLKSYFQVIKDYKNNPAKYTGKPKLTKYCKSDKKSFVITNQDCVIYTRDNGTQYMKFPYITKKFGIFLELTYLPEELSSNTKKLKEVRVIPYYDTYKLEIVYEASESKKTSSNKVAAIDPGLDNLVTLVTSDESLVINGKVVKSKNQWFNKRAAELNSKLDVMYKTSKHADSKQLTSLWKNRANWMNDYMHKVSRFIVDYCVIHDIGTIILGINPMWKQNCNINKVNNQNFVQISHSKLYSLIQYKAQMAGITVIRQEESYTSKASYVDNDDIPVFGKENEKPVFSGKRIKRGLYKAADNTLINADVNGAANIGRKALGVRPFPVSALQKVTSATL